MRTIHFFAATMIWMVCGISMAFAQLNPPLPTRAQAKITSKVTDEDGKPISGAEVGIGFLVGNAPGQGPGTKELQHRGTTSDDGMFTAQDQCGGSAGLGATKSGFYRTYAPSYLFKDIKGEQWQPWNPTVELVLKPILNPIPMYARKVYDVKVPAVGQPVGFDMMEGDWVTPHGTGKVADFLFILEKQYISVDQPFEVMLTLRFSNGDDGIQSILVPVNVGSELRLPRYAPESGYLPELVKSTSRNAANAMIERDYRDDQNYFFRVRTVKKNEKIISAHYGKIDRDIEFWGNEIIRFTYYLNPTPNDRNMEFDPGQNLFDRLPNSEKVTAP